MFQTFIRALHDLNAREKELTGQFSGVPKKQRVVCVTVTFFNHRPFFCHRYVFPGSSFQSEIISIFDSMSCYRKELHKASCIIKVSV